jgi:DNA-binding transcriptional LysR family regulator
MAAAEWLRTFLAVYRSGSVSGGADTRGLSQPAASQQLAALERRVGRSLFVRTAHGVEPTPAGRELHAQVADSLDRLEAVLDAVDTGVPSSGAATLRFGSTPEYFSAAVLPRLGPESPKLVVRLGPDAEMLDAVEGGEVDVAVTSMTPGRRSLTSTPLGPKHFVLVGSPEMAPEVAPSSTDELGAWLTGRPWCAYSAELPLTRRFWTSVLGRPFSGDLRLVVPDLRAVVVAAVAGLGFSLLPAFVCEESLRRGSLVEVHPVSELAPTETWFACTREADLAWDQLSRFVHDLSAARESVARPTADQPATPVTGRPSSR